MHWLLLLFTLSLILLPTGKYTQPAQCPCILHCYICSNSLDLQIFSLPWFMHRVGQRRIFRCVWLTRPAISLRELNTLAELRKTDIFELLFDNGLTPLFHSMEFLGHCFVCLVDAWFWIMWGVEGVLVFLNSVVNTIVCVVSMLSQFDRFWV